MTRRKYIALTATLILIGLIVYIFLFGPLFPYSPLIVGFEKQELPYVIVYTQDRHLIDDYMRIDELLTPVEDFHELDYLRKPKVFLFSDSISYIRHSPSRARFCAFYNGRIFASPWGLKEAEAEKISLEIYVSHELSHSLLHQHSGLLRAHKFPKWLAEGIAVYSSNQMGTSFYPSKDETFQLIRAGNFMPPDYFRTKKEQLIRLNVENRIPFMYSEFACIVDYLIFYAGKDKFVAFMERLTKDSDLKKTFKEIYGLEFENLLIEFRAYVTDNIDV